MACCLDQYFLQRQYWKTNRISNSTPEIVVDIPRYNKRSLTVFLIWSKHDLGMPSLMGLENEKRACWQMPEH